MLHENDKIKVHMIGWPHRCEIKTRNHFKDSAEDRCTDKYC